MVREYNEQNTIRRFLLEQLSDSERLDFELRLLTDEPLSEEVEFVEDELIDDYLAGELSSVDQSRFEEVFLSTPERERKLNAGQAMRRYFQNNPLPPPAPKPNIFSRLKKWFGSLSIPIAVPITVAAMVIVGVAVWNGVFRQSNLAKGLVALNEAYRSERPVEARVSGIDHAPFITRRSNQPVAVNEIERRHADALLIEALKQDPGSSTYHAAGKLYLLARELPMAINYLEQARQGDPQNPQIYADLGAAYLAKGSFELEAAKADENDVNAGQGSEDLARSLEYLKQALELNPNLLEALFNRALVHEHQQLTEQAKSDWRIYLQKDPNSPWAGDAQKHLQDLEEKGAKTRQNGKPTAAFLEAFAAGNDEAAWQAYVRPNGARGKIPRDLINSIVANDSQSSQSVKALTYLGQLQLNKTSDPYMADLAKVYASISPQTRVILAQAREEMLHGSALARKSQMDDAMASFENARSLFEKAGNVPETLTAERAIAAAATVQPNLPKAQEILARIITISGSRKYNWFLANCLTKQAHVEINLNNFSKAIDSVNRALELFQETNDRGEVSGALMQLGQYYSFLSDTKTSLSYLERALTLNEEEPIPDDIIWQTYITVSLNLCSLKLYRAALDYQNEALQNPSAQPEAPLTRSRNYQYLGLTYGYLKQFDLALQNVQLAYDEGKLLANERNGQSIMANAALKFGDLYRARGDPTSALAAYDESLGLYEALNFQHYSYAAHKGKFLAHLALKNDALASEELQVVLKLFDQYREKISLERQQMFFFDREQDTFDLAIDFTYFKQEDQWRAFEYSEISRARNLRDLINQGAEVNKTDLGLDLKKVESKATPSPTPLSLDELRRNLPEQVQLVQYAVLEDKLMIWTISRLNHSSKSAYVERAKLTESITTTLKQITARDDAGATASLKNLYKLIIEPIRDKLEPGKVLCFVPDKALHYVPFAALMSPDSGHYLLEDFPVMVSPSAAFLIESSKRAGGRVPVKNEQLLAVGNPLVDRTANPNAADLPGAEREVDQITSNYPLPLPKILVGRDATRSAILNAIVGADVVHFATHFQVDSRSSLLSKVLLGPEPGDRAHAQPSGLSAADIYQIKLPRTRLAVLSGCQTAIEQQFAGEGSIGFARSFLVAGVPVVVASLWPVDSDATGDLMIAFHRFRKTGLYPTTESLRRAQRQVLAKGNYRSPYYWAGFTVIGGYSTF